MTTVLPIWIDAFVALLLFASGVLTLTGAIGLFRYDTFFQRMHPPALTATLCAAAGLFCPAGPPAGGVFPFSGFCPVGAGSGARRI